MRYDDSYLKLGFTVIKSSGEDKPQCVLCSEVLASTSLKPSKLKRHLEAKHPSSVNKDIDFFERKADQLHKSKLDDTGMFSQTIKAGLKDSRKIAIGKKEKKNN